MAYSQIRLLLFDIDHFDGNAEIESQFLWEKLLNVCSINLNQYC